MFNVTYLREKAWQNPLARAQGKLPAEHIEYAGNGYYVGLSINA